MIDQTQTMIDQTQTMIDQTNHDHIQLQGLRANV